MALAAALTAAAGLSGALLLTLGWSELVAPTVRNTLWVVLGGAWAGAAVLSLVIERRQGWLQESGTGDDTYREALGHYLKGNWFEAERLLGRLLRRNVRDVEARLMLATLLRHTGRRDEAVGQLDLLVRLDGSERWELEIRRERQQLLPTAPQTNSPPGEQ